MIYLGVDLKFKLNFLIKFRLILKICAARRANLADRTIALGYEFKRREVLVLNLGKSSKAETNFTRNTSRIRPTVTKIYDTRKDVKFK